MVEKNKRRRARSSSSSLLVHACLEREHIYTRQSPAERKSLEGPRLATKEKEAREDESRRMLLERIVRQGHTEHMVQQLTCVPRMQLPPLENTSKL